MSMDVMGVKREELLDNVTFGGVATYMERAEQANVNLFILKLSNGKNKMYMRNERAVSSSLS